MNAYKCTYNEINRKMGTKAYGQLVERSRKFNTFNEAVSFSRTISNTNMNVVGVPLIVIEEPTD